MTKNDIIDILNSHKDLVGLHKYSFTISDKKAKACVAEITPDEFSLTCTIKLSTKFDKLSEDAKFNVIIHELVHGAFRLKDYMQDRCDTDKCKDDIEEFFINDITAGFCSLINREDILSLMEHYETI